MLFYTTTRPLRYNLRKGNVDAISSFLTAIVKHLKSAMDRDSWIVEAIKRAEDLQTIDGVDEPEAVETVHQLAQKFMASLGARSTGLNTTVMCKQPNHPGPRTLLRVLR